MTSESSQNYKCRYCDKQFRKESTLAAHLCEPKRRWQQETETGVQFGLRAYLQFYETTQGSARLKSYEDLFAQKDITDRNIFFKGIQNINHYLWQ